MFLRVLLRKANDVQLFSRFSPEEKNWSENSVFAETDDAENNNNNDQGELEVEAEGGGIWEGGGVEATREATMRVSWDVFWGLYEVFWDNYIWG